MNRLAMMVMKNIFRAPGAWCKLCHCAKYTEEYPEIEKYKHTTVNSAHMAVEDLKDQYPDKKL